MFMGAATIKKNGPHTRKQSVKKPFIYLLACLGLIGCGTNRPPELNVPSPDLRNPVPATIASIAEGKKRYNGGDCVICHGKKGDGRGFEARDIHMNLHDWRDRSVQANFMDSQLFYIIDRGKGSGNGRMPAYHDQNSPEQIWHMVNFIRSLSPDVPRQIGTQEK